MAPELPTSEPAMMSMGLPSENPIPAAAQPEYELSMEMTTGMSAPPNGKIMRKPRTKAIAVIVAKAVQLVVSLKKNHSPNPTITIARARLTMCCPPKVMGAPLMRPDNFRNAITEPDQVMAPMNVPRNSSSLLPIGNGAGKPNEAGLLTAAIAMNTAARPTSECMKATSSGIAVICTRRATTAPIAPPSAIQPTIKAQFLVMVSVVTTAMAIPTMPNRLPRRAVTGELKPFSARIKKTDAIRYASATEFADID